MGGVGGGERMGEEEGEKTGVLVKMGCKKEEPDFLVLQEDISTE